MSGTSTQARSGVRYVLVSVALIVSACVAIWCYHEWRQTQELNRLIQSFIGEDRPNNLPYPSGGERDPLEKKGGFNRGRVASVQGDPHYITLLIQALDDRDPEVRAIAARALGFSMDAHVVGPLLDCFSRETDSWVREVCVRGLGGYSGQDVVVALVRAADDNDAYIRGAALYSLRSMDGSLAARNMLHIADRMRTRGKGFEDTYEDAIRSVRQWIRNEKAAIDRMERELAGM